MKFWMNHKGSELIKPAHIQVPHTQRPVSLRSRLCRLAEMTAAGIFSVITVVSMILSAQPAVAIDSSGEELTVYNLEQCLDSALTNNRQRPASRYAVEMAEARHRQALAAYWPQVSAKVGMQTSDEPINFVFPQSTMTVPLVPGGLPVMMPEQEVKLMDEQSTTATLDAQWLLFDGGMRSGLTTQASGYVEMMKQQSRRTDLEIVDAVKRYYWGAVLATQLHQLGMDTLARMEATLTLTETMYKEGSGQVKKTDWLENLVMVETIRSMVAMLDKNRIMAQAVLANTIGLPWDASVKPEDGTIPFAPLTDDLNVMVANAYSFNPDWGKLEAGLKAAGGAVRTARSGHMPRVGLSGSLYRWWNDYESGLVTDENEQGWKVSVGLEIPLFSGMLTENRIREAKAQLSKLEEEKVLLKEGLGLQVRDTFVSMQAAEKSYQATLNAMEASVENRDLNTRAYQSGLVETGDVIRSQLMEAMMSAQHYKAGYDHAALLSKLNFVVGKEVWKTLQ